MRPGLGELGVDDLLELRGEPEPAFTHRVVDPGEAGIELGTEERRLVVVAVLREQRQGPLSNVCFLACHVLPLVS